MEKEQTKRRVVEELYFCLYQRSLHPELFKIDRVKRIERNRYTAEIWIVGLTHVVMVQSGNHVITELITGDPELLPKTGLATSFRFRGERDHTQSGPGEMNFILSTQIERMTPQLFPATHRDYVHYAENKELFISFEQWKHNDLEPFTFIDFDARDHEFHIHAFHAYPEDLTLLKTQSIFEVGKPLITAQW